MDKLKAFFSNRIVMIIEAVLLALLAGVFFKGHAVPFFGIACVVLAGILILDAFLTFAAAIGASFKPFSFIKEFFDRPMVRMFEGIILIIGGIILFIMTFYYLNVLSALRLGLSVFAVLDGIVTCVSAVGKK